MNRGLKHTVAAVVLGTFLLGSVFTVSAQKTKDEIETQLRALEQKKQQEQANRMKAADANRPQGAGGEREAMKSEQDSKVLAALRVAGIKVIRDVALDLTKAITKYEKKDKKCAGKTNDRCAGLVDTLGLLYVYRGVEYYNKKDYNSALADYDKATQLIPNNPFLYINMGGAYYAKEDYNNALASYNQAIKLNPNVEFLYYWRGQSYLKQKNYDQAIADFSKAIRLDPKDISTYYFRGLVYKNKGDYDNAIKDYSTVIELERGDITKCNGTGHKLEWCRQEIIGRIPGRMPNFSRFYREAYYNRGEAYLGKKDYDNAIENFNFALQIAPDDEFRERARQLLNTARESKNSDAQAVKQATQATLDATPPVPIGTGYDRVTWGASVESVKSIYQDLTVVEKNGDVITLGHKNIGNAIEERKFRFLQDKLITVTVSYGLMTGEGVGLLIEKITSIYGKPVSIMKKDAAIIHTWEYNKKTKITFTNFDIVSAYMELERLSYPDRQQAPVGAVKAMAPFDGAVSIEYEDMPAIDRQQKENAKKAEEAKKKRSDGLGL